MENVKESSPATDEGDVQGTDLRIGAEDADLLDGDEPDCGPADRVDMVDKAIDSEIQLLADAGYEDDSAVEAVFDAMEALLDEDEIEDTPEMDEPDGVKAQWVHNTMPKVKERLKAMGLDF